MKLQEKFINALSLEMGKHWSEFNVSTIEDTVGFASLCDWGVRADFRCSFTDIEVGRADTPEVFKPLYDRAKIFQANRFSDYADEIDGYTEEEELLWYDNCAVVAGVTVGWFRAGNRFDTSCEAESIYAQKNPRFVVYLWFDVDGVQSVKDRIYINGNLRSFKTIAKQIEQFYGNGI